MAVELADVKIRYSVLSGAAGDSTPGAAAGSLGKYISTTEVVSGALHNLHDVVTGAENAASDVEYKCIFLANTNAVDTYTAVTVWINAEVAGGTTVAIGIDPTAASALTGTAAQAVEVVDESTAPTGVTFSAPTDSGTALSLGTLLPSECRAIWVRRTAANTGSVANDGATLRFSGTT